MYTYIVGFSEDNFGPCIRKISIKTMSLLEKCYMRRHSQHIRVFSKRKLKANEEDKIDENMSGSLRVIVVILCRNRERLLAQVFQHWKDSVDVEHDYNEDMRIILLRRASASERRSELEIEVMFKWVLQNYSKDPSGLSNMLFSCKKKGYVVDALQQCRLEMYLPGETVMIQGDLPRFEDGQFTVLSGSCEFVIFDADAMSLLKLRSLPDRARHEMSKEILDMGRVINKLASPSGFGELASLSKVKRPASVRAGLEAPLEVIMLPTKNVLSCFSKCRGPPVAEAVDFLRQASMGHKVASSELLVGASAMTKRVLPLGTIIYYKGQPVNNVFLVVNGEVLLDTDGCVPTKGGPLPFQNPDAEKCYCMAGQSILGDEGLCGVNKTYETTAVVVSEFATIFEVSAAGKEFLLRRFELERYSALAYKDQMTQTAPLKILENVILLHSSFNNVRKAISVAHRDRGVKPTNAVVDESEITSEATLARPGINTDDNFLLDAQNMYTNKLNKNCLRNAIRIRKIMQKRSLEQLRVAAKDSIISDEYIAGKGSESLSANAKIVEEGEDKVRRALSAFYERRLRLTDENKMNDTIGLNIASHSMSMLMSAASNVMGNNIECAVSRDEESSYDGSLASAADSAKGDPTVKIREHLRQLDAAKESSADRRNAALQMEKSLHLPIAKEKSIPKMKSALQRATDASISVNSNFVRVSTRRSNKTQEYCEGLLATKHFAKITSETQLNSKKKIQSNHTDFSGSSTKPQHPSMLLPETKEELLAVFREKWEIDPIRKAAILTSQITPRYFLLSKSAKRCDHIRNLENMVNRNDIVILDDGSLVSSNTRRSLPLKGPDNLSLILKNVDSIAKDAFAITTHRKDRYESPIGSRAITPAAASGGCSRPGTSGSTAPPLEGTMLMQYFERMKSPPMEGAVDDGRASSEHQSENDEKSVSTPLAGVSKRWGKLRTAVALSSALDPERALKQYERAIRLEPKTSKYLEGKRKTAGSSKYALAPVRYSNYDNTGHSVDDDYISSVESWKRETLQELFQTKNEPKRSVPVLSTAGAQALYWEKQIIETIPKSGQVYTKRLTYHEVNQIHQNSEAERYKRRLLRSKN